MRKRALLIAEEANPEWTSVPLIGWSLSQALREVADVHLVTQVRNRPAMLRAGLEEGVDFTSIDTELLAEPLYRLGVALRGGENKNWGLNSALRRLTYPYFDWKIWRTFKRRLEAGEFDLVHRITPLTPSASGYLAGRCKEAGVPFVWGPINGGVPWPKGFEEARHREKEWPSFLREGFKLLPGYAQARESSAALIMGAGIAAAEVPQRWQDRCVYMPENAIESERFNSRAEGEVKLPLKVCFVGRLVPLKGVDMLIEALGPLMREGLAELTIIGGGDERRHLETQCDHLKIRDKVEFTGFIPHRELQAHLVNAHVFGFPSIREFGGGAVLEAMALGLPPVILDYAGPAELVTPTTGWKVPLTNRGQIVESLRAVFSSIIDDPAEVRRRGDAAYRRAHHWFTWPKKAEMIGEVYDWVTGERPDKPNFGFPLPDPPAEG